MGLELSKYILETFMGYFYVFVSLYIAEGVVGFVCIVIGNCIRCFVVFVTFCTWCLTYLCLCFEYLD